MVHFNLRHLESDPHSGLCCGVMKLQEFCLTLLNFPLLSKIAEWKFHCGDFYVSKIIEIVADLTRTFAA